MTKQLILFLSIFITSCCGWHSQNHTEELNQVKSIKVSLLDNINSHLIRSIYNQLRLYGIEIPQKEPICQNVLSINILKSTIRQERASISYNTNTTEYLLIMSVDANILIPHRGIYPINSTVYRSFFDNFRANLAKNAEREFIINEMYDKVAEEILYAALNILNKNSKIVERILK